MNQVWNASEPVRNITMRRFITVTVTVPAAVIDSFSVSDNSPDA